MKILRQIFILLLLVFNLSFAQFGQNKVQYDVFDWNFIQSKHFNIFSITFAFGTSSTPIGIVLKDGKFPITIGVIIETAVDILGTKC